MKRIILFTVGIISLVLGSIGVVMPVLPTTPFLLLALWCFIRSSEKLYNFILNNKYLGPYVRDYMSGRGIPMKVKKRSISLLWITIGFSAVFVVESPFMKGMLILIACCVSYHIWTRKTAQRN